MNLKFKVRIYALFQFVSLVALLFGVFAVMVSFIDTPFKGSTIAFWKDRLKEILFFNQTGTYGALGSVLFWTALGMWLFTWVMGWTLFMVKDRNFYDQLFLLFVCIPIISNIFALFAQLSLNTHKFTNSKLAKEEIEQEKTKIINLFELKKKTLAKEVKGDKDEVVKVSAKIDSTPDIKMTATSAKIDKHKNVTQVAEKKSTLVIEPKVKSEVKKAPVKKQVVKKATTKKPVAKPAIKKASPAKSNIRKANKK